MTEADVILPALSAAGGGLTVGWIAKLLITSWFKKHEQMAEALHTVTIQLTRIEERVTALQRAEERLKGWETALAVMKQKLDDLEERVTAVAELAVKT